jgi:hypothetical protein
LKVENEKTELIFYGEKGLPNRILQNYVVRQSLKTVKQGSPLTPEGGKR